MMINKNSNNVNFSARLLSTTSVKNAVRPSYNVEIFSLNKADGVFINKISEAIKNNTLLEDKLQIANNKELKKGILESLKKALNLDAKSKNEGVLLAIKDRKSIVGLAEYNDRGDINLETLYTFQKDSKNITRKSLLLQILKNISKQKEQGIYIKAESMNSEGDKYYRHFGFKKDKVFKLKDIFIDNENIGKSIEKLKNDIKLINNRSASEEYDLNNIMGI